MSSLFITATTIYNNDLVISLHCHPQTVNEVSGSVTGLTNNIFLQVFIGLQKVLVSCPKHLLNRQYNGQTKKDKQWFTKYYTSN